jgi:hypothetical protein
MRRRVGKKKEPIVVVAKVNAQVNKPPRPLNYPCYICGIMGHKSTNYAKLGEMETCLNEKIIENKPITKVKVASTCFN